MADIPEDPSAPKTDSRQNPNISQHGLRAIWEIYRDYMKHEDDLLNQRSTWHLVIQGFLFATLGVIREAQLVNGSVDLFHTQRHYLLFVISGVGFFIALTVLISMEAANNSIEALCTKWDKFISLQFDGGMWDLLPPLAGGGHPNAKRDGKMPARLIPIIIAIAWLLIGGMAVKDLSNRSDQTSAVVQPIPTPVSVTCVVAAPPPQTKAKSLKHKTSQSNKAESKK